MTATHAKQRVKPELMTADDLLRLHAEGIDGELIRGVFCEIMPPGYRHEEIIIAIGALLRTFVRPHRLGRVSGGSGVWLERDLDTVRAPDVAFHSVDRMPYGVDTPGYTEVVPDLVVEVVSPNDHSHAVNDKAEMWLRRGVRLVWVVWPDRGSVQVYHPTEPVVELGEDATLDGGDVLPGFSAAVADFFAE